MGLQRRLSIYVGYNSPSIIRFLEPLTGDLFTAKFANCHFDETQFSLLETPKASKEEKQKKIDILSWRENDLTHLDLCTPECEKKIQRIIHLQEIANRLPDAFNDTAKVTKSHIPTVNTPTRIYVPEEHKKMDDNVPRQKCNRPIGSKDAAPRKKRGRNQESLLLQSEQSAPREEITPEVVETHEKINDPGNTEISINYCNDLWNRNDIIIDDMLVFSVAHEIMHDDYEPQSITKSHQRQDWPKWEEAIQTKLSSLSKRDVFGPIAQTPDNVKRGIQMDIFQETK
ncbi:hypothetical protein CRYUN_Cryun02cG0130100 [Craigia yunnanensis]